MYEPIEMRRQFLRSCANFFVKLTEQVKEIQADAMNYQEFEQVCLLTSLDLSPAYKWWIKLQRLGQPVSTSSN